MGRIQSPRLFYFLGSCFIIAIAGGGRLTGQEHEFYEMNIVLIGYRCSGKTVVGKIVSKELGRDFFDTDALIEEKAGCSIDTLVCEKGWAHFRDMEKRVIEALSMADNLVIATGGGIVVNAENLRNLKKNGWMVWLYGTPEVLKARMDKDQKAGKLRPCISGTDPSDEIVQILKIPTHRF